MAEFLKSIVVDCAHKTFVREAGTGAGSLTFCFYNDESNNGGDYFLRLFLPISFCRLLLIFFLNRNFEGVLCLYGSTRTRKVLVLFSTGYGTYSRGINEYYSTYGTSTASSYFGTVLYRYCAGTVLHVIHYSVRGFAMWDYVLGAPAQDLIIIICR